MGFKFCESMVHDYWQQGYVVFRGILPPSLLNDLRPEADKARALARQLHGPQAQRLQPVVRYADQINIKPFDDYMELPPLVEAIDKLLTPAMLGLQPPGARFCHFTRTVLGLLVEPTRPRHHGWHRDWVSNYKLSEQKTPERLAEYQAKWHKPTSGNQVNCAIYPDSCLWYVPGSHLRIHDMSWEKQAYDYHTEKDITDTMLNASDAEIERVGLETCRAFRGAVRLHLEAGDFCVYRSTGWHTGLYSPLQPRATIHDSVRWDGWDKPREQPIVQNAVAADAVQK